MPDQTQPPITAVVAMTPSGVIGLNGDMPWRLRSDLQRFKKLTMGGTLVMGRKTYDSIGRPLPGRQTIVISRQAGLTFDGVQVVTSPTQAIESRGDQPIFVVGGAEIYRQLMPHCDQIYLTRVHSEVEGDTHLELDLAEFRIVEQYEIPAGPHDDVRTEFFHMVREAPGQKS